MKGPASLQEKWEREQEQPLNKHCREMLRKVGEPVHHRVEGVPELLEWALREKKVEVLPGARDDLHRAVDQLQRAPLGAGRKLLAVTAEGEPDRQARLALESNDPVEVAELLLQNLHETMSLGETGYNPNIPGSLQTEIRELGMEDPKRS